MRSILLIGILFSSFTSFSNPIAGSWQGPCVEIPDRDTSATYVYKFKKVDETTGTMEQTRTYYEGAGCGEVKHAGGFGVTYVLRESDKENIYEIDISTTGDNSKTYYDIFTITKSKGFTFLTFGESWNKTTPEERPTVLSDQDRIFIKID